MKVVSEVCLLFLLAYGTLVTAQNELESRVRGESHRQLMMMMGKGKGMMGGMSKSGKGGGSVIINPEVIIDACYNSSDWAKCQKKCSKSKKLKSCVEMGADKSCSKLLKGLKMNVKSQITQGVVKKVESEKCTTAAPTVSPTAAPTVAPTASPTKAPSPPPTAIDTDAPSAAPVV